MTDKHIINTIVEITGIPAEEVTLESHLFDELDVDSLDMAQITLSLENHYHIDFTDEAVADLHTVQDLIDMIAAQLEA
jgi:acyl carrier protein